MTGIILKSYPRIHLGLLELSGVCDRVDGGVGFAISSFPTIVSVNASHSFCMKSNCKSAEHICEYVMQDLKDYLPKTNIEIVIETQSNIHLGLGFTTQCLFSIAQAILLFYSIDIPKDKLAHILKRGGTSGIGIHSFYHGGFIVDGGHSFPTNKNVLGPTSQCVTNSIPPLLSRIDFPRWAVCIVIPKVNTVLCNKDEVEFWNCSVPIPIDESRILCHNLLLRILPALVEQDFSAFCDGVDNSRLYGLKKREIAYWQPLFDKYYQILYQAGWRGITLSSLGPAIVGFSDNKEAIKYDILEKNNELFKYVSITTGQNTGYEVFGRG